ncbi:MAG: AbrB/MazE/SpoVT family DNA-binding domain-containing protein [Nitrososphaeria archaeon]
MISPVKIRNGSVEIPKDLMEKAGIDENTLLILVPVERGILITPLMPIELKEKKNTQSVQSEINAMIIELLHPNKNSTTPKEKMTVKR